MKRFIAFVACFTLSLCCILGFSGCSQQNSLKLGTGNEEGMYYQFGNALADMANNVSDAPALDVVSTAGSSANLRLLSQGFLDIATVQADTLYDAANGTGLFANSEPYDGYSVVAGLYTEACQIVVPADSDIKTVADLAGKTVSIGERESGVLQNALQILEAYNLRESDFTPEYLSFSDSAAAIKDGSIDAAFVTAAVPTPAVTSLADEVGIRLLSLDADVIKTLIAHHGYYMSCTIPADTYKGQSENVLTVGVKAVLVARNDISDAQVKAVLNLLFDENSAFAEKLPNDMQPVIEEAVVGIPTGFHSGAAAFFAEKGMNVDVSNGTSGTNAINASQDN